MHPPIALRRLFTICLLLVSAPVGCPGYADEPGESVAPAQSAAFDEAKRLYDEGKWDNAEAAFKKLVELNPLDTDSRRYIRSIISIKRKMAHRDQNVLERDRILDVRRAWVPVKGNISAGAAQQVPDASKTKTVAEQVREIIPEINFSDAQVRDVLLYLSKTSGVNIVFDETGGDGTQEVSQSLASRVTISLKDVPMIEALKYILYAKGLKYRLDEHAVLISTPARLDKVEMETRYYYLSSGSGGFGAAYPKIKTGRWRKEGGRPSAATLDLDDEGGDRSAVSPLSAGITIKDILEQSGVPFPSGSKIFLDKRLGVLIVRNTPSNLAVIEKILGALDVAPYQIAIEAKFVDIVESAAREMGLEAFLTGNFNLTKQDGTGDLTILQNANNTTFGQFTGSTQGRGGLSKGVRFLTESGSTTNPAGNIFSFAQVLTQPQFQLVLHALEQSGMANVLSAPKVTTVNNQEAQIEVVTEIIYPTDYQITPATANAAGTIITPGMALPGGFVTRDTGVILLVTPSVGSDKKTINLTLRPEVSTLSGWNNFGISAGPSNLGSNAIPVLQPIFTSQNVSASVIVQDSETVVLGGLIREVSDTTDDKIPVLGDIPGLGKIFRNQTTSTSKRNLLIFVTAYLITPDGETVHEPRYAKTKIFNP